MLVTNQITELISTQFVQLALYQIVMWALIIFYFKQKLSLKQSLLIIILGFIFAGISALVMNSAMGGMSEHQRYGWPFQYYIISKDVIEVDVETYRHHFDFFKFVANSFYWSFYASILVWVKTNKNSSFRMFALLALAIFVAITIFFSVTNA